MAVRTTDEEVEAIIEVDSRISLTPFIVAANQIVTDNCTDYTTDYTVAKLTLIETWLAAHFYTVRDMRASEERAGTVSERKQSKVDLGFDTSHYGQMAMRIDNLGGLAALNEKIKAGSVKSVGITWLGTKADDDE